jgi:hypothetical protein
MKTKPVGYKYWWSIDKKVPVTYKEIGKGLIILGTSILLSILLLWLMI